ncbi:HAD-like protein [Patellaria atrata CBS 101060]|uniref:HAD-like protein n=1 Tax=Patellaria atrata CBS 101060 TaxID=1346257 RepID=A0A9P4SEB6_9PEZI|nr:HAD-like protein [Patellaria atrata CBS 101060]
MTTSSPRPRRRFAPLNPEVLNKYDAPKLEGIVFDVDGTLCLPQNYMFAEMRAALGITKDQDILESIYALPPEEQEAAMEKIRKIERRAMASQQPQPGLVELMTYLDMRGIRKGICTRNFDLPVTHLLRTHLPTSPFSPIITRAFRPPKPSPAGILHIAASWGLFQPSVSPSPIPLDPPIPSTTIAPEPPAQLPTATNLIMVGDSLDDLLAGHAAGAATVLLLYDPDDGRGNAHLVDRADLVVRTLDELVAVLEGGFVGSLEEV